MSTEIVHHHRDVYNLIVKDLHVTTFFNEGDGHYYLDAYVVLRGDSTLVHLSRQRIIDHTSPREFNARLHDATKHLTDLLTRELKFHLASYRKDETV